jgi:hypothetical protein
MGGDDSIDQIRMDELGTIYFLAFNSINKFAYKYDGTTVTQISTGDTDKIELFNNDLYLSQLSGLNYKSYRYSNSLLEPLEEINAGDDDFVSGFYPTDSGLYVTTSSNSAGGVKLFSIQGLEIEMVHDFNPGTSDNISVFGTSKGLFFNVNYKPYWIRDGVLVSLESLGDEELFTAQTTLVHGDDIYFISRTNFTADKLFVYSKGRVTQLSDLNHGGSDFYNTWLIEYQGGLVFSANMGGAVSEIVQLQKYTFPGN